MPFYLNFEKISLHEFEVMLSETDLVPSRMILKESMEEKFTKFRRENIANLEELFQALKTKVKVKNCSDKWNIEEEYLSILIREIKSYRQPPVKLRDFIGFNSQDILNIEGLGIKTALQLYNQVKTPQLRRELAERIPMNYQALLKLTKHMDLSRVRWVNHTFAYLLYEAGCTRPEQLAQADYTQLHKAVNEVNEKLSVFKGKIGLHDFELTIEAAKHITFDVIYE